MTKSFVVCLTLAASTCLAGIVIETWKPHESANLVEATIDILTSCYKNRVQAVGLVGNTPGILLKALWAQESFPVILMDNTSTGGYNGPVRRGFRCKLLLFIITASSATQLKQILRQIKNSPWWNHMASFFIVDWSIVSKHGCSNVSEFLWTAWEMDLLNAKLMCFHRTKGRLIYGYNPYTSNAPESWHLEDTFEGKTDDPWTLIVRKYRDGEKACEDLDFEKTDDLGGHEIRSTVKDIPGAWHTDTNKTGIDSFTEYQGVLAQYIFRALNATPNLKAHRLADGPGFSSGNVADIVKEVIDGISAIMLNPRGITLRGNTTMTYPSLYLGLYSATQHRGLESTLNKILSVLDIYSRFGLLLVAVITLIFFKYFLHQTLVSAIISLLRIICNSCLLRLPTNLPARIYLACLFFLYVTIQAIYQGKLAAVLTKQRPVRNVDTMQDLADLGYRIYGYKTISVFFTHPVFQGRYIGTNSFSCLEYVLRDASAACIWPRDYDNLKNVKLKPKLKLHISKDEIIDTSMIYVIRENWPLEQRVNRILMTLFETGITQKTVMKGTQRLFDAEKFHEKLANMEKFNIITLDEFIFAFAILGFGLGCASVCFIVEVAIEWVRLNVRRYIRNRLG